MEKRVIIAFILALGVLILWQFLFSPVKQEQQKPAEEKEIAIQEEVLSNEEKIQQATSVAQEEGLEREIIETPIEEKIEREIIVENSYYQITFSNRGGVVTSWRLKEHLDDYGEPLELVSSASKNLNIYPLQLKSGDNELDTKLNNALYEVATETLAMTDRLGKTVEGQRITFKYADGSGLYIEKILEIPYGEYLSQIMFSMQNIAGDISPSLIWGAGFGKRRQNSTRFYYSGQAIANISGRVSRTAEKKVEEEKALSGNIEWVGLEDQYFSIIFIPKSNIDTIKLLSSKLSNEEGKEERYLSLSIPKIDNGYSLYVGPKDYHILSNIGYDLKNAINFGSISIIALIAKGLFFSLIWLYERVFPNYGLAIIIVTVVIRILFFPLTQKSFVSMKKMQTQMQKVQPKINAIKTKYKKKGLDFKKRQTMNQEIMDLYKKEGINPMGGMTGCLPLLLQLPILWAFYNVLRVAVELRHAPLFLWIKDLSVKDPYYITPLLMGATMLIQQKMSGPTGGDPFQQKMMLMMPIIFTFFFISFPSGLVLYWLANNVLGIGQQYLINKQAKKLIAREKK